MEDRGRGENLRKRTWQMANFGERRRNMEYEMREKWGAIRMERTNDNCICMEWSWRQSISISIFITTLLNYAVCFEDGVADSIGNEDGVKAWRRIYHDAPHSTTQIRFEEVEIFGQISYGLKTMPTGGHSDLLYTSKARDTLHCTYMERSLAGFVYKEEMIQR